ncbi:HNH endonuclease [Wenxinia marina]|uniref:Putative HNH nuclease YajD n=1 Tax=Wenxinia marina DSM 24838 TaxID=1123501 RepID=A0A0D0PHE6_9RHOB|nr:HNH endonuclease signature motif containing protein [Wenxinia marina]KIQ70761.1 Restriction endonuclease [Wenxinia marina DSM 24838]
MNLRKQYAAHSRRITRQPRWKALREAVKDRDGWACVLCGARTRLEVDHVKPVRDWPELAWDMGNLQTLCCRCHSRKNPRRNRPRP